MMCVFKQCVVWSTSSINLIFFEIYFFSFFFQAEDGIRDLVRSRGLGDVYKRQMVNTVRYAVGTVPIGAALSMFVAVLLNQKIRGRGLYSCLLYTSDAADDLLCVDLGGRRNIKKTKQDSIILITPDIIQDAQDNNINTTHTHKL